MRVRPDATFVLIVYEIIIILTVASVFYMIGVEQTLPNAFCATPRSALARSGVRSIPVSSTIPLSFVALLLSLSLVVLNALFSLLTFLQFILSDLVQTLSVHPLQTILVYKAPLFAKSTRRQGTPFISQLFMVFSVLKSYVNLLLDFNKFVFCFQHG